MILIPEEAQLALSYLNESYEAVLVGGYVRDCLLHRESEDLDIATSALPEQVKQVFSSFPVYDTGIHHGTVTVIIHQRPLEITTYRVEKNYLDHRHPEQVIYTPSLEEDLKRRDFTINALCYTQQDTILDYFGGLEDLKAGLIRAIGNPLERFDEDALRIMRAIRFCGQLNFTIEPATKQALFQAKKTLEAVAIERLMKEMEKLLLCDQAGDLLNLYYPVLGVFIPELNSLHKKPLLWQHVVERLNRCPKLLTFRYACLFADLGCLKSDDFSSMLSASCFLETARRLKLSNSITAKVAMLIQNQNVPLSPHRIALKKRLMHWNDSFFEILNWKEVLGTPKEELDAIKLMLQDILSSSPCLSLKQLAIRGEDVQHLGYCGSDIRFILEKCLEQVVEEKIPNRREDLLYYIQSRG